MHHLTPEEIQALAQRLPYGIIVLKSEDEKLENIKLVFANETAEMTAKYPVSSEYIGKTIIDLSPDHKISEEFATAWHSLMDKDDPTTLAKLDFGEVASEAGIYDVTMYRIGKHAVVLTYKNVTKYTEIQKKINAIQDKLKALAEEAGPPEPLPKPWMPPAGTKAPTK